jgi:hypothetical protein
MSSFRRPIVLGILLLATHSARADESPHVSRGTLITAMGNKQGIVLMTDSMVTYTDTSGHSWQDPRKPVQKLMRYNDKWVCATAGLLSLAKPKISPGPDTLSPRLQSQVLGLIKFYADAMKKQGTSQSMADALAALSALIRQHFTIRANIDFSIGVPDEANLEAYQMELFLAGSDIDGQLKIGRVDIALRSEHWSDGKAHWIAVEKENDCKLRTIKNELTICKGGIDTIEKDMLAHPEAYTEASVMKDFVAQMHKDNGASLTIDQMEKLGHLFKVQTAYFEPAVGGPDEVATITKDEIKLKGVDGFDPLLKPSPMIILSCQTGMTFPISSYLNLPDNHTPLFFQHCVIFQEEHKLDGNIYVQCIFRDSNLLYLGGDTLFAEDNQIEGKSSLSVGAPSCRRPDIVEQLQKRFDVFHGGLLFPEPGESGKYIIGPSLCAALKNRQNQQPPR